MGLAQTEWTYYAARRRGHSAGVCVCTCVLTMSDTRVPGTMEVCASGRSLPSHRVRLRPLHSHRRHWMRVCTARLRRLGTCGWRRRCVGADTRTSTGGQISKAVHTRSIQCVFQHAFVHLLCAARHRQQSSNTTRWIRSTGRGSTIPGFGDRSRSVSRSPLFTIMRAVPVDGQW